MILFFGPVVHPSGFVVLRSIQKSARKNCNKALFKKNSRILIFDDALFITGWFGIIFLRQGIYQEGIFRFRLLIPENYPDGDCPRLLFDHPVYHPLVDPNTHELDVKRLFVKWKRNVNHIWQILSHARRSFYKIETKDGWNPEAAAK